MMARGTSVRRWRLVRAPQDAMPSSARRFHQRIRRRRLRVLLPWAAALVALALVGVLVWVVTSTSALGVRQIQVTGAHLVSVAEVRAAAGVPLSTPLAGVDVDAVRDRVERLVPVASATVRREWPSTLVIAVAERVAVATVPVGKKYVLIDLEGVVYHTVTGKPADLPVVKLAAPGPDDPSTRAALRVLAALTPTLRSKLIALAAPAPTRIRLELAGGRAVVWGDAEESETKARVATSLLARPGRTIDVSAPEVVTVG